MPLAPIQGFSCSDLLTRLTDHGRYLAWERARDLKKDQQALAFDWYRTPRPEYGDDTFNPLQVQPIGAVPFALERMLVKGCHFPANPATYPPLDEALFHGSDLTSSSFKDVSLKKASFDPYDLDKAPTILRGVDFTGADLTGATFAKAEMSGVLFEPDKLPAAKDIAEAHNLEQMTYAQNSSALFALRQLFRDGGFSEQDSEINYAIHQRMLQLKRERCSPNDGRGRDYRECVSLLGSKIIDWTCQYGLNLWRPVEMAVGAWVLFAAIFFLFMHHAGESGLYLLVAHGIVLKADDVATAPQVLSSSFSEAVATKHTRSWLVEQYRLARVAVFFSLINGFNIGFKDADIGRWLRLLPRREFEFRAVGWARTFAGIQALLMLYLVTVWVLCLFGHPFD